MIDKKIKIEIEVYKIGTKVVLDGDIKAKVVGLSLSGDMTPSYKLMWWNERNLVFEWLLDRFKQELTND